MLPGQQDNQDPDPPKNTIFFPGQPDNQHPFLQRLRCFFPLDNETTKHIMKCEYGCPVVQAMGKA